MYYVYEWYIVATGEVIYVGKGTKHRYKVRKHNNLFNEMIRRFDCDSRIIQYFDSERDAFEYEFVRINELKMKGECVCNIHKGGFGGTVDWWTDELRKKYSDNNVMKSEEQRKRMSENNPMKNPDIAEKSNRQKRKFVIIGNRKYPSVKNACDELGVCSEVIATWCKKGINPNGEACHYEGTPQAVYTNKRYNIGSCRPVVYKNRTYECLTDFANEIGISVNTALDWVQRGYNPKGISCRYLDDTSEHVFVDRYKARNQARSKPVVINGVEYKSVGVASKELKIAKTTIYFYLEGKRKNTKYICKYGNQ